MHQAAVHGNTDITYALLDGHANIDLRDKKGLRPLHYAAWKVKCLLSNCGVACISGGRLVKAFAVGATAYGLILSRVKPMTEIDIRSFPVFLHCRKSSVIVTSLHLFRVKWKWYLHCWDPVPVVTYQLATGALLFIWLHNTDMRKCARCCFSMEQICLLDKVMAAVRWILRASLGGERCVLLVVIEAVSARPWSCCCRYVVSEFDGSWRNLS